MAIRSLKPAIFQIKKLPLIEAIIIIVVMCVQALPANEIVLNTNGYVPYVPYSESADLRQDDLRALYQGDLWAEIQQPYCVWTIDYRFRSVCGSSTSYEFGTSVPAPIGWTPLSRLNFNLDSLWHGLELGFQRPLWGVHCEWLMPMQRNIQGDLKDYDWMIPGEPYTDLGIAHQRWNDGQMLDLAIEFRIWDEAFGLPIDVWPILGFRWQRFDITCYDAIQVKENNVWPPNPPFYPGDGLTFNQQYYIGYLGGQLRTVLDFGLMRPIDLTFQGDWGATAAYNVDHHLLRAGDRYTMESTHGDSWHVALTAEVPVTRRLSLGLEADYLQIHTRGTHRLLNEPLGIDETWDYGVRAWSAQTWLTAFVRLRI